MSVVEVREFLKSDNSISFRHILILVFVEMRQEKNFC